MSNKKGIIVKYLLIFLGIISIVISIVNTLYLIKNNTFGNKLISWIPSFIVLACSYLMKFKIIDTNEIADNLLVSYPFQRDKLKADRFINFLFISMNFGLLGTILIYYQFLIGVFFYFLMHLSIIYSLSGIINLDFKDLVKNKRILYITIINFIFWFIVTNCLFFCIAYNGLISLILLPYAYILGFMASISFLGVFYCKPCIFRIVLVLGAVIFIISDTIIGYLGSHRESFLVYFVNPTYVTAIVFLAFSPIFIKKSRNRPV